MEYDQTVCRVPTISGGGSANFGFMGIDVRWSVSEEHCEMKMTVWFTMKIGLKRIRLSTTYGWVGCKEGLDVAREFARQFDVKEIQVCDPETILSDAHLFEAFPSAGHTGDHQTP